MNRVLPRQRFWLIDDVFLPRRSEKSRFFTNLKIHYMTLETLGNTPGHLEKHRTFASEALMTRRAVVSRVIRVQRRYVVRIRPS